MWDREIKTKTRPAKTDTDAFIIRYLKKIRKSLQKVITSGNRDRFERASPPPPNEPTPGSRIIRILIVDFYEETRLNLRKFITDQPNMVVVGEAENGLEGTYLYRKLRPDIVSTDISLPFMDGIEMTATIVSFNPEANVFILSVLYERDYMVRALKAGAKDFLPKPANREEYIATIRSCSLPSQNESEKPSHTQVDPIVFDVGEQLILAKNQWDQQIIEAPNSYIDPNFAQCAEQIVSEDDSIKIIRHVNRYQQTIGIIPTLLLNSNFQVPNLTYRFDVNAVLEAFDRVSCVDEYVMDYIYAKNDYAGEPYLYTRPKDEYPLETVAEYCNRFGLEKPTSLLFLEPDYETTRPFLEHLTFTKDPVGYFQFALFTMLIREFYLYRISDRMDRKYLITQAAFNTVKKQFDMGSKQSGPEEILAVYPEITVKINGEYGKVKIPSYSPSQGFSLLHLNCKWPNEFLGIKDEIILRCSGNTKSYSSSLSRNFWY